MFQIPRVRFFKLPEPRQFNYTPRLYDEAKERREAQLDKLKSELGSENIELKIDREEPYTPRIKGQFKSNFNRNVKSKRQSNLRLVIIAAVLFAIAFWIIYF